MPLRNSCIKNHIAKASCLKFFFFLGHPAARGSWARDQIRATVMTYAAGAPVPDA